MEKSSLPVRLVNVTRTERITPHMQRITFGGDSLADFVHDATPDQQVKLYFPRAGQTVPCLPEPAEDGDVMRWYYAFAAIPADERPWQRSYTLRAYDPQHCTIDIDFVLHGDGDGDGGGDDADAGPATRWARTARPGDTLGMFGPSAYFARPVPLGTTDWTLLAGDETALPAIGTLIEALPEGARAVAYVEVGGPADEQRFESRGDVTVHWLHRGTAPAGHSDVLVEAVRGAEFPAGSVFAWLAGESGAVRALRRHLVDERGIGKRSVDFTGCWRLRLTQDDAPTAEDLAEAQERLADAPQT
ncbi:siderophore-interacting protein [Streptomyces sp. ISL-98]|uniref:siderophore-interacting protein n=1 Tax=Streptomyces sp. ISL-98 TaxID=2819192 RepID=UPI001BE71C38|nr:siderophore-interacting protein [Streptomyces sp. ISL-98]MBT2511287.1 siderophore-interacting protein [Streptomyces sp. ISL-98]